MHLGKSRTSTVRKRSVQNATELGVDAGAHAACRIGVVKMKTDQDRNLWLQKLLAERSYTMNRLTTIEARQADERRSNFRILIGSTVVAACSLIAAALVV